MSFSWHATALYGHGDCDNEHHHLHHHRHITAVSLRRTTIWPDCSPVADRPRPWRYDLSATLRGLGAYTVVCQSINQFSAMMLNEAKTSRRRPRPRPRPRIIMKKYQIMINNIRFEIIAGKINKIPEFYTIFARKMPDYIIRRRDTRSIRGQAEAKCLKPRPRPNLWGRTVPPETVS